jgi:hypothetical protein
VSKKEEALYKEFEVYCPLCGGDLKLVPRKPFNYVEDWYDIPTEKEQDEYLERVRNYEECQRDEYECTGKRCFQKDFPLYHHQPFQGIDSAPGDSWSLSWVK